MISQIPSQLIKEEQRVRHQSRQLDYRSADDGILDEEAPDLGPLQEAAEATELAGAHVWAHR